MGSRNSLGSNKLTLFPFILEEITPFGENQNSSGRNGLTLFPSILEESAPSGENPNSLCRNGLTLFPSILEESAPSDEFESDGLYDPVGIPKILNLFPVTPVVESSTRQRDSTQGLGLKTLQTFLREQGIDALTRSESKHLLSQFDNHDPTLPLFKCPDSGYVRRDEIPVQMSMMRDIQQDQVQMSMLRDIQQDLPVLTSDSPSRGQSQPTDHGEMSSPSANSPLQDPYVTSSRGKGVDKGKGKMTEADGGLSNIGPNYIDLSGWKSKMLGHGNLNGPSGYASSSMAPSLSYPLMAANINQSEYLMGVPYLNGEGVGTSVPKKTRKPRKHSNAGRGKLFARYGPQPKSSPFRGVTHYKRTNRWEAHIWHKGTQLYISASATAEQAARCYDRAAIHFRRINAQLNYTWIDYATELRQLMEVSDSKLLKILRKQSFGEGTLYPDYPPLKEH